jgi:hypothetical protein
MPDGQIQAATEDPDIGGLLREVQGRFSPENDLYRRALAYAKFGDIASWRWIVDGALQDGVAWIEHLQGQQR